MLELKNVKKSYDGTPVLTDISLNIEDVEKVCAIIKEFLEEYNHEEN